MAPRAARAADPSNTARRVWSGGGVEVAPAAPTERPASCGVARAGSGTAGLAGAGGGGVGVAGARRPLTACRRGLRPARPKATARVCMWGEWGDTRTRTRAHAGLKRCRWGVGAACDEKARVRERGDLARPTPAHFFFFLHCWPLTTTHARAHAMPALSGTHQPALRSAARQVRV